MIQSLYFSLLPSEVCRLILGYLKDLGCERTCSAFLEECSHLSEIKSQVQKSCNMSLRVGGFSLAEILEDYFDVVNLANAKQETTFQGWIPEHIPSCRPGEVASLLKCLLFESSKSPNGPIPEYVKNFKSVPIRTSLKPPANQSTNVVVLKPKDQSTPSRIRIITTPSKLCGPKPSSASSNTTNDRVQPTAEATQLSSIPKPQLERDSGSASNTPSKSASSRRKPQGKPNHVKEGAAGASLNASLENEEEINFERVLSSLAENADTVADLINCNLANATSSEVSAAQTEPQDLDNAYANLSETDWNRLVQELLEDFDLVDPPPQSQEANKSGSGSTTAAANPARTPQPSTSRGKIPFKALSNSTAEPETSTTAAVHSEPSGSETSVASPQPSPPVRAVDKSPVSLTTDKPLPSTSASPAPTRGRRKTVTTRRKQPDSTRTTSREVPCEAYPTTPSHAMLQRLIPQSSRIPTASLRPLPTHIVDLDGISPAEPPTTANRFVIRLPSSSLGTVVSQPQPQWCTPMNILPQSDPQISAQRQQQQQQQHITTAVPYQVVYGNPAAATTTTTHLPVVDLNTPITTPIATIYPTPNQVNKGSPSSCLANSRLLAYINNTGVADSSANSSRSVARVVTPTPISVPPTLIESTNPSEAVVKPQTPISPGSKENEMPSGRRTPSEGLTAAAGTPGNVVAPPNPSKRARKRKIDLSALDIEATLKKIH